MKNNFEEKIAIIEKRKNDLILQGKMLNEEKKKILKQQKNYEAKIIFEYEKKIGKRITKLFSKDFEFNFLNLDKNEIEEIIQRAEKIFSENRLFILGENQNEKNLSEGISEKGKSEEQDN